MNKEQKEEFFLKYMSSLCTELEQLLNYSEKHSIMLSMVFIDIGATIFDNFNGNKNQSKVRFINWYEKFVLVPPNEINADDFYNLRCSLLHFGGIPKPFMFEGPYNSLHQTLKFKETTKDIQVQVISKPNTIAFISKGYIKMLELMQRECKKDTKKYEKFLDLMVDKIKQDGSIYLFVPYEL